MNRILLITLLLCFAFLLTHCSSTSKISNEEKSDPRQKREVIPLTGSFKVNRYSLDNGLRLLVVEDHSSPTFAYQTWFRVGSRDEETGKTGLAHLFEHMMFKGTKNLKEGEFDKLLESAGAEGENAFTSRDFTAYIQELPKGQTELITRLEADRMVNLIINDSAFKTEREVVQNERRFRNENNPDGTLDQELFKMAFTRHSYGWPVIGYQEDLNNMTAENALKFYHQYYRPNHATIIVSGDVDPDHIYSLVQKYYGALASQSPPEHTIPKEPVQHFPRQKELKLNIQVEKLYMGYHIPEITHKDMPALTVLQSVLTGGNSSRLLRALVETGVATSVDSYDFEDKDPSLFVVVANLQQKKHASQAEAIILKEFARVSREPISKSELERAKNKISFGFYEGLNSNYQKAYFLGHYEAVSGDFTEGLKLLEKIQLVTIPEIQAVAKHYLNPKGRTVVTGVKK